MVDVTMTMEEYLQLINGLSSEMPVEQVQVQPEPKPKRRATAYQRKYKANFKRLHPDSGSRMADGKKADSRQL